MVDVWRNHTDAAAVKAGKLPRQLAGDKGGRARCVYLLLLCHPKILRNLPDIPASLCVSGTNVCCSLMKWSFPTLIFDISDRKLLRLFMIKIKTHGFCVFFPRCFLAPGFVPSDFVEPAEVLEDIDVINRSPEGARRSSGSFASPFPFKLKGSVQRASTL